MWLDLSRARATCNEANTMRVSSDLSDAGFASKYSSHFNLVAPIQYKRSKGGSKKKDEEREHLGVVPRHEHRRP